MYHVLPGAWAGHSTACSRARSLPVKRGPLLLFVVCAGAAFVAFWPAAKPPRPPLDVAVVTQALSAEALQGRQLGTEGERRAGGFIAQQLAALGLQPRVQPFSTRVEDAGVTSFGNVSALLEGRAPGASVLVLVAHYDHLGFGPRHSLDPFTQALHPGADDNASGVAVLLSLADQLEARPTPLPFDVLFLATSAEEEDLSGAQFALTSGLVDPKRTFAVINLDMVGRLDPTRPLLAAEGTVETPAWKTMLPPSAFQLQLDPLTPGSSDHCVFADAGLPVLSLSSGRTADYHRPSDTAARLNLAGLNAVRDWVRQLIEALAAQPPPYLPAR